VQPKFWKTMEIRANARKNQENDLSEIRLNSGNLIIILHKNSGKLSTAPHLESISPVRLWILLVNFGGKYFTQWLFCLTVTLNPNITYYLSELFFSFFQHAKMIQNKFQLNSDKSSGSRCQHYHLVSSIYLLNLSPRLFSLRCNALSS
jgi:hypothetical protein